MTREELKRHCLKQIENCEMWARYKGEEPHGKVYEEHKLILELLEQEPRWISVSERLPEDHKDVLAYLSSDRISICRYNSHKLPFSNNPIGWGYLPGIGFIDFKKEHVIAWMPLPKPYKAESER